MYKINFKNNISRGISFISIIIFMLIFSFTTSPLFNLNKLGQDSSVFLMMGKGILQGKVPFVDYFENKGPLLYFIEALPQIFIDGSLGIWLLQVSIVILNIYILSIISKKLIGKADGVFITFCYIGYLALCYEGGNLSEEYSIFFIILSLYIFITYIKDSKAYDKKWYGLVLGICFTCVVFIRITDAVVIAGVIMSLMCFTISNKLYKSLVSNIITFIIGTFLITIPIVSYYLVNGALKEMIKGYFLVNAQYVTTGTTSILEDRLNILKMPYGKFTIFILGGLVLSIIIFAISKTYNKKNETKAIILLLTIIDILGFITVLISKSSYFHYLIILLPQVVISLIIIKEYIVDLVRVFYYSKVITIIIALFTICGSFVAYNYYNKNIYYIKPPIKDIFTLNSMSKNVENIKKIIPENEYDSVYILNMFSNWYRQAEIYPSYKHFLLMVYVQIDPNLKNEFEEYMINTPPKWLIIDQKEYNHYDLLTKKTLEIFKEGYEEVYSDNVATLYRKK